MYTLKFATMDRRGNLDGGAEAISVSAPGVKEAVRAANNFLSGHGGQHVPFMPGLWDEKGELVARTVAESPHAHKLTLIAGTAAGSTDEWICV